MEENTINQESVPQNLQLDPGAISHLKETRTWTNFISIVGFVFLGLMLILGIAGGSWMTRMNPYQGMGSGFFLFIMIVMIAIYFFPIYFLFNFSRNAKMAILNKDAVALAEAMRYLKLHYRYLGILMIIVLSIYLLALIFGIMAGSFMNMF